MARYQPKLIEKHWQNYWEREELYRAKNHSKKPKYYQLETFPYPSAAGLHVGHPKGYIAEDIHARYMRMNGHEVLYTMGWDAFGLPTENYAIKVGKSPREVAQSNIKNFKRQVKMFGLSYDWEREINTSSPYYYKWTQWLFIQLFKNGLAYRKKATVNWCPKDQTVLANEQVIDGKCERDGEPVVQKEMEQWFFKITDYADRLLNDLEELDWPEATIKRQKDWIGRSQGATIRFSLARSSASSPHSSATSIEVFTTRPDTLFGATYLVLAPEHEIISKIKNQKSPASARLGRGQAKLQFKIKNWKEVERYIETARKKTELQRKEGEKEKTGVSLEGITAVNPANNEHLPVWVADYVLASYGTGAIMAVPAHDRRDFEFAKKYGLRITEVISSAGTDGAALKEAYEGPGRLVNSGRFDGLNSEKAKRRIVEFIGAKTQIQYKLRDWSVSRQRYWGAPIPIIYCGACGTVPVPEKDLPVRLPPLKNYRPKGRPPLASSDDFINTECPQCDGKAKRDAETLDTFVDSSWYYLRYTDPKNNKVIFDKEKADSWMPVDLYVIGAEHTVLHLLYSRFITKFLHDQKYIKFKEPFLKIKHVGLILGEDGQKMSKSRGNVVNPDELVESVGADTVRLYEMFMGPFEESQPWDPKSIIGVYRFLNRIYALFKNNLQLTTYESHTNSKSQIKNSKQNTKDKKLEQVLHRTIKKVGEDIDNFRFNTAVSELMKLLNEFEKSESQLSDADCQMFVKLIAPFAPHLAEEIWQTCLERKNSVHLEKWPKYNPGLIKNELVKLIIQVNGKTRDFIELPADSSEETVKNFALKSDGAARHIKEGKIKKIIFVPNKLINIVVY